MNEPKWYTVIFQTGVDLFAGIRRKSIDVQAYNAEDAHYQAKITVNEPTTKTIAIVPCRKTLVGGRHHEEADPQEYGGCGGAVDCDCDDEDICDSKCEFCGADLDDGED